MVLLEINRTIFSLPGAELLRNLLANVAQGRVARVQDYSRSSAARVFRPYDSNDEILDRDEEEPMDCESDGSSLDFLRVDKKAFKATRREKRKARRKRQRAADKNYIQLDKGFSLTPSDTLGIGEDTFSSSQIIKEHDPVPSENAERLSHINAHPAGSDEHSAVIGRFYNESSERRQNHASGHETRNMHYSPDTIHFDSQEIIAMPESNTKEGIYV